MIKNKIQKAMAERRWLVVAVAIFVAAVLLFGIVFGTIVTVRQSRAVLSYRGTTVDREMYAYFAATLKSKYLAVFDVSYSEADRFFDTDAGDGLTHGEAFAALCENYVREVLVGAALYDRFAVVSDAATAVIRRTQGDVLKNFGSQSEFNARAAQYGFDYDAFCRASVLLYKAWSAADVQYGVDGSKMKTDAGACQDFLQENYAHVKLLFIRTESKFLLDENGERVTEGNMDQTVPLTEQERAQREEIVTALRRAIEQDNAEVAYFTYNDYLSRYDDGEAKYRTSGYYFSIDPMSAYTGEFSAEFPTVVATACTMAVGSYAEVDTSIGKCFLYRYPVAEGAYADANLSEMFEDFYGYAATALHAETLRALSGGVQKHAAFDRSDLHGYPCPSDNSFSLRGFS